MPRTVEAEAGAGQGRAGQGVSLFASARLKRYDAKGPLWVVDGLET